MKKVRAIVAGTPFDLDRGALERRLAREVPEPVRDHYVVIGGKRFPPKQVLEVATGLERLDFTTHQARAVMKRLGFEVGRTRGSRAAEASVRYAAMPVAERELKRYRDSWVAVRDGRVVVAGSSPHEVVAALRERSERAETMFKVSADTSEEPIGFG
jgi:hypothetical protein